MFPSINPVKKLQRDLADEIDLPHADDTAVGAATGISALLRRFGSSIDEERTPQPPSRPDWSALIDRIRATAQHVRAVDAQSRARDEEVEDLLRRVRDDMSEAQERVRAAEARADLAEERARVSEEWLMRIQEVIRTEFAGSYGAVG